MLHIFSLALVLSTNLLNPANALPTNRPTPRAPLHRVSNRTAVQANRYIVGVASEGHVRAAHNSHAKSVIEDLVSSYGATRDPAKAPGVFPRLGLVALTLTANQLEAVRAHEGVVAVEEAQTIYTYGRDAPSWGLDRINQWEYPLDGDATYFGNGSGVDVYVLDTGIDIDHPQFEGRAQNLYTFFDTYTDSVGHGTHVAGIIGSKEFGVASGVNLYSVKVLEQLTGTVEGVYGGLEAVLAHYNGTRPGIINMSTGGSYSYWLNHKVGEMVKRGILVVAAAGNGATDACGISPASTPEVLTVGASELGDLVASYSNWGRCVDLYAPGTGIWSTVPTTFLPPTGLRAASGTSQAAPHVTGVAALFLGAFPGATPGQTQEAILGSAQADRLHGLSPITYTANLLLSANLKPVIISPTQHTVTQTRTGNTVTQTVTESTVTQGAVTQTVTQTVTEKPATQTVTVTEQCTQIPPTDSSTPGEFNTMTTMLHA